MRVHQRLQRTHNQNYDMMRVWIVWQAQVFADIKEQLKYNWLSMSSWQYGEHILAIYDCKQGFPLMFGETFNLRKTLFEHRGQNFCEDTFWNLSDTGESWSKLWTNQYLAVKCLFKQFPSLVKTGKIYFKKCNDRYPHRPLGITNQTNQSCWFACLWKYQPI